MPPTDHRQPAERLTSADGAEVRYPRRAASKADTRRRLVHSALTLFQRHGFEGTRVADIAALAGVTERTFFVHFPTKADVLFDVLADELDELRRLILAQPDDRSDLHLLESVLLEFCRIASEERHLRHQQVQLLLRAAESSPTLRGRQLDYNQMMVDTAAQALALRRHQTTPSLVTLTASRTVFRIFHAIVIDWAAHKPGDLDDIARRHFAALNSLLELTPQTAVQDNPALTSNGPPRKRRPTRPKPG